VVHGLPELPVALLVARLEPFGDRRQLPLRRAAAESCLLRRPT
jgi:hypothetical protein